MKKDVLFLQVDIIEIMDLTPRYMLKNIHYCICSLVTGETKDSTQSSFDAFVYFLRQDNPIFFA